MNDRNENVGGLLSRFLGDLKFPQLFVVTALVFLADLVMPDVIPFVDEILLGLATLVLASLRKRKEDRKAPPPRPPVEDRTDETPPPR